MADQVNSTYDEDLRSSSSGRLLEVYTQMQAAEEVKYMIAILMTTSETYSYALRISNELNGLQGKNRAVVSYDSMELMRYSIETDVDELMDKKILDLFVAILNTYLADKQELPQNAREAAGVKSRVKALMIMLIRTNQYGIIPLLTIPTWLLRDVSDIFTELRKIKDEVTNAWIQYLESTGNIEMAEIVRSLGNEFWGSEGIKANVIWDRHFGKIQDKIKNPAETYEKYKELRAAYRKTTKNIMPSKVYDIFDITPDAYDKARRSVYAELEQLYPEDDNIQVIQKLVLE